MTDPHPDPVDALLREAFAADRVATPTPDVTAPVMARIRRRRYGRRLTVGLGGALGLAVAALSARPAVNALLATVAAEVPGAWNDSALLLGTVTLIAAGWLLFLEEEAG